VLPDVWFAFGQNPDERIDLLMVPFRGTSPGDVAVELRGHGLGELGQVAYHQSTVAASLTFAELVRVILPLSYWRKEFGSEVEKWLAMPQLTHAELLQVGTALTAFERGRMDLVGQAERSEDLTTPLVLWTLRLVGSIELARQGRANELRDTPSNRIEIPLTQASASSVLDAARSLIDPTIEAKQLIFSVSLNRDANVTVFRSVPAVKADAARRVFAIDATELRWAVIDSGIDATHPAFRRRDESDSLVAEPFGGKNETRIVESYDFTPVRQLLDVDRLRGRKPSDYDKNTLERLAAQPELTNELVETLDNGRPVSWTHFAPLLRIAHTDAAYRRPINEHGTHVAAILAGDWRRSDRSGGPHRSVNDWPAIDNDLVGVCPTLELFDLRVLGDDGRGDEFAVMAALQFVRGLNSQFDYLTVHGVNLSMAIKHDVANYACGRTPICEEAARLVATGAVVVAAAGNEGYVRNPESTFDYDEGYRSISITDPGNAEDVITVGATHGYRPLTYGVSYFSSRGPTGDGRRKPDLVAPGEKIWSAVPKGGVRTLDGTSMAAPHVSGCAALLMARHRELIGDPARIKRILCASATDLGREPYFQGNGLVDVLRAIQSM
jgi:hypothetical protein